MNYYQLRKEHTRQLAMEWQIESGKEHLSYGEIATYTNKLEKLGKRYGLLKEFKENGIC